MAPPCTPSELFAAYEASVLASLDLAADITPSDLGRTTPCPGWTLFDLYAHLESGDAWFLGEPLPPLDVSHREHARGRFAVTIEKLVESRRARPLERILADIACHLDAWRQRVLELEGSGSPLWESPMGPSEVERVLGIRLFDTWIHEQDIRETLGRPGPLDTAGAQYAVGRLLRAWPSIVERAGPGDGTVVALVVTGPTRASAAARVVATAEGTTAKPVDPSAATATTVITADTHAATRLAAGRRPLGEPYHWTATGDQRIAQAVVAAFAITP